MSLSMPVMTFVPGFTMLTFVGLLKVIAGAPPVKLLVYPSVPPYGA
jgi:hypothetical protein